MKKRRNKAANGEEYDRVLMTISKNSISQNPTNVVISSGLMLSDKFL